MVHTLAEAGKRDRWVTIERATYTKNARNESIPTWDVHKRRWASAKPAPGTERFQNAETAASAPMRFVFLWEEDLVEVEDRVLHDDGRRYSVVSVIDIGRREGLEVLGVARKE